MQRESIHEARVSVRPFRTDSIPSPPPTTPAAFWRRVDWPVVFQITALLLHLAGGLWLLLLTAFYVQELGWLATLPHAAFLPIYAFLAAYGALRWWKGDSRTLYRSAAANGLLVVIY